MSDAKVNFSVETLEPRLLLAAFEWTGAGGDSLWENAANWTADGQLTADLPNEDDDVTISETGTVALNTYASILSLQTSGNLTINSGATLLAEMVDINNGTTTVSGGWNVATTNVNADLSFVHGFKRGKIVFNSNVSLETLHVFGGALLDGTGNIIINSTMTWGGALYGTGRIIVASGSAMTIENNTYATLKLAKVIDNFGVITWKNDWISSDPQKAIINNFGAFFVESDKPFYGSSQFNNFGTFAKTAGTTANPIYATFSNSGEIADPLKFVFYELIEGVPNFDLTTTSTPLIYTQGSGQVPVDPNLTITDYYNRTISSGFVMISQGYIAGQDTIELSQKNPFIIDYFDAKSGMLVLISTSDSTSAYDYQQALQSVQFSTTDTNPATTSPNITFIVSGSNAFGEAYRGVEIATPLTTAKPAWKSASGKYPRDVKEIQRLVGAEETGIYDEQTIVQVQKYQRELIASGLYNGQDDGHWGPQTDRAYRLSIALSKIKLSTKGIELLKSVEELRLLPYDDSAPNAPPPTKWVKGATIGYGHLISQQEWDKYKNGISEAQAEQLLQDDFWDVRIHIALNITATLTENQIDAIIILAFNIGYPLFNNSDALKLINDPSAKTKFKDLESAWKAFNISRGKVLKGLVNRRNSEWNIYSKGVYEKWN